MDEEVAHRRCNRVEHVACEVVENVSRVTREVDDETARILLLLHDEQDERDAREPAFGSEHEALELGWLEQEARHAGERGSLARRQAEIGGSYLGQLTVTAKACYRQTGVGSARDHDLHSFGSTLHEHPYGRVADRVPDRMPVLEYEDEASRARELFDQEGEDGLRNGSWPGAERRKRGLAHTFARLVQRGDDVDPQSDRIGVAFVERHPRKWRLPLVGGLPLREEGRLPVAGSGAHEVSRRSRPPRSRSTSSRRSMRSRRRRGGRSFVGTTNTRPDDSERGVTWVSCAASISSRVVTL